MKYLIYELFSGVGYCNQLFSLETAIYLACISKRKLILIIKHPLCHCGTASWKFGNFMDMISNDYQQYLPFGIDICYGKNSSEVQEMLSKSPPEIFNNRLSRIGIIDKDIYEQYNCDISHEKIKSFLHNREIHILDLEDKIWSQEVIITKQSNASRCFYNFMTSHENYEIMSNICASLSKPTPVIQNILKNISLPKNFMSFHFRFGDHKHSKMEIDRNAEGKYHKIQQYIDCYNPEQILIMCDRKDSYIIEKLNDYAINHGKQILFIEDMLETLVIEESIPSIIDFSVINFLVGKMICEEANCFVGWKMSTVSNHIQYNHFLQGKNHHLYVEGETITGDNYSWIHSHVFGPAIAFKIFFKDNIVCENACN